MADTSSDHTSVKRENGIGIYMLNVNDAAREAW